MNDIDFDSGIASVQDKGDESGPKTRLLYLPKSVRVQVQKYEKYRRTMEITFFKNPAPPLPCYFVDADRNAILITPSLLEEKMRKYLPFPANVARHFIRTELMERGLPPEIVDAWMGHASRGEQQWGKFACFSYRKSIEALEATLVPLLKELGFKPIYCLGVYINDSR
jgi:integrase